MNLSFATAGASLAVALQGGGLVLSVGKPMADDVGDLDMQAALFGALSEEPLPDAPALEVEPESADVVDVIGEALAQMVIMQDKAQPFVEQADGVVASDGIDEESDGWAEPKRAPITLSAPSLPPQAMALSQRIALAVDRQPQTIASSASMVSMPEIQVRQNIGEAMQAFRSATQQGGDAPELQPATSTVRTPTADVSPQASFTTQYSQLEGASAKPIAAANTAPEQKLLGALGERISVQAGQGIQHAVIRLDPHMAGSVRIELRHEAGALQVRISASHAEVTQQLQAISDGLRQELNNRQFNDVTVQVSQGRHADQGGRGGQPHQGQDDEAPHRQQPGRALAVDTADDAFDAVWQRSIDSIGYRA